MNTKFLIGGVVIVAVGLLIYGGLSRSNVPTNNAASIHNNVSSGSDRNNLAPDFTLQKLTGGTISLSEFRGKKPVVVDFWASWCPNCRRDMPKLNIFYEKYKNKVEVIGVNLQEGKSTVKDFIASRGISFQIALDPSGQASNAFGIQYTNTHFLIDKAGNLVRTIPGDISEADIESLIKADDVSNTQSSLPDEKPCKIASAKGVQDGEQTGVCKNSS
ncbi:MAG: redoxin domain-containing protein [Candidatus Liptonbacteria bacterium]|nr:redoxin domain-containing protein [Candidatus Liptonbacteria bacterium]